MKNKYGGYIDSEKDKYSKRCAYYNPEVNKPKNDDDLPCKIGEGSLWFKDTDDIWIFEKHKWKRILQSQQKSFYFSSNNETNNLEEVIVKTFVFPDFYEKFYPEISKITFGTSWSQAVVNPVINNQVVPWTQQNGMVITLRDKGEPSICYLQKQIVPTTYEITSSCKSDGIPNPGDELEIVIRLPNNQTPPGQGVLNSFILEISPFLRKKEEKC